MSKAIVRNMAESVAAAACAQFVTNGYTAMLSRSRVFDINSTTRIKISGKPNNFAVSLVNPVSGSTRTCTYQVGRDKKAVIDMGNTPHHKGDDLQFALDLTTLLLRLMCELTVMGEARVWNEGGTGHSSLEMQPTERVKRSGVSVSE